MAEGGYNPAGAKVADVAQVYGAGETTSSPAATASTSRTENWQHERVHVEAVRGDLADVASNAQSTFLHFDDEDQEQLYGEYVVRRNYVVGSQRHHQSYRERGKPMNSPPPSSPLYPPHTTDPLLHHTAALPLLRDRPGHSRALRGDTLEPSTHGGALSLRRGNGAGHYVWIVRCATGYTALGPLLGLHGLAHLPSFCCAPRHSDAVYKRVSVERCEERDDPYRKRVQNSRRHRCARAHRHAPPRIREACPCPSSLIGAMVARRLARLSHSLGATSRTPWRQSTPAPSLFARMTCCQVVGKSTWSTASSSNGA